LITTSKLFFARLDKLTDQLEGTLTPNNLVEIYNRFHNADITMSVREATLRRNKEVKNIENFKKYTLVSCWTQNPEESFALWKIYLGNQPYGISIQTRYRNLKESIIDTNFPLLFGKVCYSNNVKDIKQSSVYLRKNKFYKFENEVRILIMNQYVTFGGEPKYDTGTTIEVEIKKMIEKIYVSPFSPDWFFELVKNIVEGKFNFHIPICRSLIKES
jgi:hypothetical protein